jgi:hypothetical protein
MFEGLRMRWYERRLNHRNHKVVLNAVTALGRIGGKKVEGTLVDLLKNSSDRDIKARAATAIGNIAGDSATELLIEALSGPARAEAAEALGKIGQKSAVGPLLRVLKEETWLPTYRSITSALLKLGWTPTTEIMAEEFKTYLAYKMGMSMRFGLDMERTKQELLKEMARKYSCSERAFLEKIETHL